MPSQLSSADETLSLHDAIGDLLDIARELGAGEADALATGGISSSVTCRGGRVEDVQQSDQRDICLRAIIDQRQAIVSTSDFRRSSLRSLAERAVLMARQAPRDPTCGLVEAKLLHQGEIANLELYDASEPSPEELKEMARAAENAALAVDGVTKTEGAGAGWDSGQVFLATSSGFHGDYRRSSFSASVSAIVGEGLSMERDYDYSSTRWLADLKDPQSIGTEAGTRAVQRLNPKKIESTVLPVIFEPRVSNTLLGHFASAINGLAIARGTSFLKDKMGEQLFKDGINVVDDPAKPRGLRSKPFDGEGMAASAISLVKEGRLGSWLLDAASARKLSLEPNGRASRGIGGPPSPSPTNLYMEGGEASPEDLIASVKRGLYVTEMIGMGVSLLTGDYSRGATGFWIENGEIAYPVSEITIAGNLLEMFTAITPASDLKFQFGTNAPTLLIDQMTVAGN